MQTSSIDVTDADFEAAVIERSRHTPVVVDFWAPWCGPCRVLGPLLERLAEEQQGAFVLAKVDIDTNPALAQALRIQSIPAVMGFRDGQIVAEFVGALPEAGVREFLAKVLPSPADKHAAAGNALWADGKVDAAEAEFQAALADDPRCEAALLGLARVFGHRNDPGQALQLLERILPGPLRQDADRLAAQLRIQEAGAGDESTLRATLAASPADHATRLRLAQVLAAAARYEDALMEYLEIVRRDRNFQDGAARKAMLDVFDLLGSGHELVDRYRSELAKILFS